MGNNEDATYCCMLLSLQMQLRGEIVLMSFEKIIVVMLALSAELPFGDLCRLD